MKVHNANNLPLIPIADLLPTQGELKYLTEQNYNKLKNNIKRRGFIDPVSVWDDDKGLKHLLNGHQRQRVLMQEGWNEPIPYFSIPAKDIQEAAAIVLELTSQYGTITQEGLDSHIAKYQLNEAEVYESTSFEATSFDGLKSYGDSDEKYSDGVGGSLVDKFIVPPFSILDTKQEYWQTRRTTWLDMGIKSELGRQDGLLGKDDNIMAGINKGTSIFDPVLCEIVYSWFNTQSGQILDCFAGGSVRGIVASHLKMPYIGVELRKEQVAANREQGEQLCDSVPPVWIEGDSTNINELTDNVKADLLFSCPPYADLEVYSDDPADISNMAYEDFYTIYVNIIKESCSQLKDDRFAVFVVGEVRNKKGNYYNFVGDTIKAFIQAGLSYYNELILVNSAGTLPLRAGRQFNSGRKIGKMHQNVLVFYKGNTQKIKDNYPKLELSNETEK